MLDGIGNGNYRERRTVGLYYYQEIPNFGFDLLSSQLSQVNYCRCSE